LTTESEENDQSRQSRFLRLKISLIIIGVLRLPDLPLAMMDTRRYGKSE
jgi:hypothetical protein